MHRLVATFVLAGFAGLAGTLVLAGSVSSQVPPGGYPSSMPSTPMPSIKGCSSSQRTYLEEAWRLAHFTTWRAKRLLQSIQSRPVSERPALWNRDFVVGDAWSASPRRWFGTYDAGNASFIREAVDKAEARFRKKASGVKGINTIRCGQPGIIDNEHVDVCPKGNPGGSGPPDAYHFPIKTIVVCPGFLRNVDNKFVDRALLLRSSAAVLVHELMHHLAVNGKYVRDRQYDGAGGTKDKKYYGLDNVTWLAENKRSWAKRNNDTYAYFTRGVGAAKPVFSGSWAAKAPGRTGALYYDMSWNGLVARWNELSKKGQYLADVETYVRDGQRRYAGLWRMGLGNGDLYAATWQPFASHWARTKGSQDLIDVEVYQHGPDLRYIGVYRKKPDPKAGDGGLLRGLTWNGLVEKWKAFGGSAYLADVESYEDGGARRYVAVWRTGTGNGSLLLSTSRSSFEGYKRSRHGHEQLIDFERWIENGGWKFLGVWQASASWGPLHPALSTSDFVAKWSELSSKATLIDIEEHSALPLRVP